MVVDDNSVRTVTTDVKKDAQGDASAELSGSKNQTNVDTSVSVPVTTSNPSTSTSSVQPVLDATDSANSSLGDVEFSSTARDVSPVISTSASRSVSDLALVGAAAFVCVGMIVAFRRRR